MGFIDLNDVTYALPGGWTLFEGVGFRVPARIEGIFEVELEGIHVPIAEVRVTP